MTGTPEYKEFDEIIYHYVDSFGEKIFAQVEAYALRHSGRLARVVRVSGNWAVYATAEGWVVR